VRKRIGLAGQYAAVDENLTGFENLEVVGRLYHLGRKRSSEQSSSARWRSPASATSSRAET
jgi:ABC-2 type transport system ATP-binding protein